MYIKQVKGHHTVLTTAYEKCLSSYVIVKATPILIAFIWKSPAGRGGGGLNYCCLLSFHLTLQVLLVTNNNFLRTISIHLQTFPRLLRSL